MDGSTASQLHDIVAHDAFTISPDGGHVAFATGEEFDWRRLMVSPIEGGSELELDPNGVRAFKFSPVHVGGLLRVVYSNAGEDQLLSVGIDGGTPVLLTPTPFHYSSDVVFAVTSDGARVVFKARYGTDTDELFSVELLGGTPIALSDPLPAGGNVTSFRLSPDGSTAVYRTDQDADEVFEVYSVPVTDGNTEKAISSRAGTVSASRSVATISG